MGTSISQIIQVTTAALGIAPGLATGLAASNIAPTTLTLSWVAPTIGSQPFFYQPQLLAPGGTTFQNLPGTPIATTSIAVTGLLPASTYQFRVLTSNTTATSTSAAISVTTPSVVPGAATGLAVVGTPGQADIALQWAAPVQGTPPFSYQVFSRTPSGSGTFVAGPTTSALTLDITGLTTGSSYDFEILTSNAAGAGAFSAALINVHTASSTNVLPSAPTNLVAGTITQTSIAVSWTPPSQGTPPLSYTVQYRPH